MFELLYTSISPKGLSEVELKALLQQARTKNQSLNVTGMLIYHNHEIMQLLEGDEDTVKNLFQSIFFDNRHRSVEIFYQGNIEERAFQGWSMAFKSLEDMKLSELIPSYESFDREQSPISAIKDIPNRGKETLLSLRDTL